MALFHGNAIPSGAEAYTIDNSLRFNSADNAFLNHTAGNFQPTSPYTISCWVKRSKLGANGYIYRINSADNLYFNTSDQISLERRSTSFTTTRKFRDVSNWYHIVVKSTTSAVTLYINGVQEQTASGTANPYTAGRFDIGCANASSGYFGGYISQFHYVQGQSLGPESFGKEGTYGEWKPIEYTGGHGSTGFYLPFTNSGTKYTIQSGGGINHVAGISKWGNSSLSFNNTSTYLKVPYSEIGNTMRMAGDFTMELWVKSKETNNSGVFFGNHSHATGHGFAFGFNGTNIVKFWDYPNGFNTGDVNFGYDTSNWFHFAAVRSGSTLKLYKDGVEKTSHTYTHTLPNAQNWPLYIGNDANEGSFSLNAYVDDCRISNVARYTSNFTPPTGAFTSDANTILLVQSDTTNGSTVFTDSSGVDGGLGNDASGQNNHFTMNNITSSDQMTDSPTNNFPVMNNLNNQAFATTFAEGNLQITTGGGGQEPGNMATMGMKSGKWYFEVCQAGGGSNNAMIGIRGTQAGINGAGDNPGRVSDGYAFYGYHSAQNIVNNGSYVTYGSVVSYTTGDVISVAVDLDNNKCYWAKNGTYLNSGNPAGNSNGLSITAAASTKLGEYFPCFGDYDANSYQLVANFGQDGTFGGNVSAGGYSDANNYGNFKYQVPAGFLSLCSANLSDPTVKPAENFNTVLWTGDGGSNRAISSGLSEVDLVWIKSRSNADDHRLGDIVRGGNPIEHLKPNTNEAAITNGTTVLKSISGGTFNVGSDGSVNGSGSTYVAWNWKAGGAGSANTDGSINSTVSANVDAGFSIVSYTGTGSDATVGHGLSKAPELFMVKTRDLTHDWAVYSSALTSADYTLQLNENISESTSWDLWNDLDPTASVLNLGTAPASNASGDDYIAYCFHSVEGYSKIGRYRGNDNVDGAFIYTGFRPKFILCKVITASDGWQMQDAVRSPVNPTALRVEANTSTVEQTGSWAHVDFLSNGFKTRFTDRIWNKNYYYMYYAIAEQPFKYSNAK